MFNFCRKEKVRKYIEKVAEYILHIYEEPVPCRTFQNSEIRYCLRQDYEPEYLEETEENFNTADVIQGLRRCSVSGDTMAMHQVLERNREQTFVDKLLYYIKKKGMRDPKVYKAAQVDKRLFSKIVSNREYKPSKDTVIALALALKLSLEEANDILARAGYVLSHSTKRDIIIECCFREEIYNLIDVNDILYNLNEKMLGRL